MLFTEQQLVSIVNVGAVITIEKVELKLCLFGVELSVTVTVNVSGAVLGKALVGVPLIVPVD